MKKNLSILFLVLSSSFLAFSQGTWTPRDTLPYDTNAMYQGIPGFSVGNYGYAGLGEHDVPYKILDDIWQFDPSSDSWTKKTSFPGNARVGLACFVICNNAYLVTGSIYNAGTCVTECWEYDATANTWTQRANFPGPARTYAVGFAINGRGYVGTGANELNDFRKDFYRFNPDSNTWTRVADFGGIARSGASGFSVNGYGYVCFGQDSTIKYYADMWEYNPGTNTWTQKTDYPAEGILGANGFAICNNIYVGCGDSAGFDFDRRFWSYNTITNTWSQENSEPGITTALGASFSVSDTGYFGFGIDSVGRIQNKFYSFYAGDTCQTIDTCDISEGYQPISSESGITIYPNPTSQQLTINFNSQNTGLVTLSIMDVTGREIMNEECKMNNEKYMIDISALSAGMYFLNVKTKDNFFTQKFIKD